MLTCFEVAAYAVVIVLLIYIIACKESFSKGREIKARNIYAMKSMFDERRDTLAKARLADPDLDVVEYYDVRNVMKNCTSPDSCIKNIASYIDD